VRREEECQDSADTVREIGWAGGEEEEKDAADWESVEVDRLLLSR